MSHHFDDQGSKYDIKGNLSDWWTPKDVENFKALTGKLVKEYDAYEVFPGAHVKGEFTLGENIGDLAGIQAAYDAYHASLNGQDAAGDRRHDRRPALLSGLGAGVAAQLSRGEPRARLLTDPHAPSAQRTWIVRNFDPWYPAFKVQPGQKLYLAPAERVRIW